MSEATVTSAAVIRPVSACSADQLERLFAGGGWPAFIGADREAATALPRVRERFARHELAVVADDAVVAARWGVPLVWNGTVEDLPGGYGDSLRRALLGQDQDAGADTFVIEDYVQWRRDDGTAFDPWLRLHERLGGRVLAVCQASQAFTGTTAEWEEWSGLVLPASGRYLVPDALAPLDLDREADRGTCREPAIWVEHHPPGNSG